MNAEANFDNEETPMKREFLPPALKLDIAYQAPNRAVRRVLLRASGTTDPGYDCIETIESDHIGSLGLKDVGVHIYINSKGEIEWGRSLERAPEFPKDSTSEDIAILIHGHEISMSKDALNTLRALLPIINAIHGNALVFDGLPKHHARLGVGRDGKLIEVALQAPPELA
jgi:hypothetical protein